MKMPTVTLTTDWGERGFFAGMVKGALMRAVDGVQVVDITHRLEAYNIMTASFVVRHACTGFPENTVHIIDVGSYEPFIALRAKGQYYICSDNGLPSLALGDSVEEAVSLPTREGGIYNFAAYSLFTPIASKLLLGAHLSDLGEPHPQLLQRPWQGYIMQGDYIRIYVQYIDDYGNAYLGMNYNEFEQLRQGRPFVLQVLEMEVSELSLGYRHPGHSRPTTSSDFSLQLTVSATGQLELALRERSLAQLIGLKPNSSVLLRFK